MIAKREGNFELGRENEEGYCYEVGLVNLSG